MILLLAYGSMMFAIVLYELARPKLVLVDFLSLFHVFFVFTYLAPPIAFLANPAMTGDWRFLALVPEAATSGLVLVTIAIGYLSLIVGFHLGVRQRAEVYPELGFRYGTRTQFVSLLAFLVAGLLAFLAYAHGHGGILELVLKGKDIRTQRQHAGVMQYFGFFAAVLPIAAMLLFSFWRCGNRAMRKWAWVAFGVAFVTALAYALGTAGRGNIGFVLLALLITWLNLDRRGVTVKKFLVISLFAVFVFLLITYGKSAIWTLGALADGIPAYFNALVSHRQWYSSAAGSTGLGSTLVDFLRNIDHAVVSIFTSLHYPEAYQAPRLIFDWPRALVELVPGVSQPEFVVSHTPSGLNRDFFNADGYVPPGWIAMKLINGGVLWLALGTLIAGTIGGYMSRVIWAAWYSSPVVPGLFTLLAFFWKDYIVGPDPFMVVMSNLPLLLLAVCFGWLVVFRVKRQAHAVEILS